MTGRCTNSAVVSIGVFTALAAFVLALPGCSWLVGEWAGDAPKAQERMTFSHKKHVVGEEVECGDCHGAVAESTSLQGKRHMPKEEACMSCHDRADDCTKCHKDPKAPQRWADRRMNGIVFSHKAHMQRKLPGGKNGEGEGATCFTCHTTVKTATSIGQDARPEMFAVCGQCHQKDFSREGCQRCHTNLVDNNREPLSMFAHTGDWLERHGAAAHGSVTVCAHCHTESTCAGCHARTNPMIARVSLLNPTEVGRRTHHRGDWLARHSIEARLDPARCLSCHQESRCLDCHQQRKVASHKIGQGSPHPAGWMTPGAPRSHGSEARANPLACASCHDRGAESNCVTCHRVGGSGGTPHPPGWRSSLNKTSSPACVPCHM